MEIFLVSSNLYYKVENDHPRAHWPVKACIFIINNFTHVQHEALALMQALVCDGSYRVPSAGYIYPCR